MRTSTPVPVRLLPLRLLLPVANLRLCLHLCMCLLCMSAYSLARALGYAKTCLPGADVGHTWPCLGYVSTTVRRESYRAYKQTA